MEGYQLGCNPERFPVTVSKDLIHDMIKADFKTFSKLSKTMTLMDKRLYKQLYQSLGATHPLLPLS